MKRAKLLVFLFLMLFAFSGNVYAAKKKNDVKKEEEVAPKIVNVYMLTKEGCSGCEAAYEYFDELNENNPDLFILIPFEVFDKNWQWNSDELKTLFTKTYEYFGEETDKASTPTIVVGNYHTLGLPNDGTIIYNAIISAQKEDDVIAKIAKDNNLDIENLKYDRSKKEDTKDAENKYDALIVIGIFVVLIGGFAGLIVLGKK